MRVLHLTDIHFNKIHMAWVRSKSREADVVCLTGDFINNRYDCDTSPIEQASQINMWLQSILVPVFVCSGNHDELGDNLDSSWLQNVGNVYSDNSIKEMHGVVFGSAPFGTTCFDNFSECDVLLNHEPPSGLKVANQKGRDFGSRYLTRAIKDGTLSLNWLLCGHVHSPEKMTARFRNCCISNPGSSFNATSPNHHWITI